MLRRFERSLERIVFASRWLLAPLYIGLILTLLIVITVFAREAWALTQTMLSSPEDAEEQVKLLILGILGLLDLTLLANLILIVIFAGYENFVSKIGAARNSEDRPHWMGHVDFSGLKIKLIGSLVAISVIELLQDFIRPLASHDYQQIRYRIALHITFLISGVLFAVMDYIGDKRKVLLDEHAERMHRLGAHSSVDVADGT